MKKLVRLHLPNARMVQSGCKDGRKRCRWKSRFWSGSDDLRPMEQGLLNTRSGGAWKRFRTSPVGTTHPVQCVDFHGLRSAFLDFSFCLSFFQVYKCCNHIAYTFSKIMHFFLSFQLKFCIVYINAELFSRLQNLSSSGRFKSSKLMCKNSIFDTN